MHMLSPLTGRILPPTREDTNGEIEGNIRFSQPFLNDFHSHLLTLMDERRIRISEVVERQWCLRYTLTRSGEIAIVDIWYNGNSIFTRCQSVTNLGSSGDLLHEVLEVVTGGMAA